MTDHHRLVGAGITTILLLGAAARATTPVAALREYLEKPVARRPALAGEPFAAAPLSKEDAVVAQQLLWDDHMADLRATRAGEWERRSITAGDKTMPFVTRTFGVRPKDGWDLYLSMHGGGNTRPEINDQQWKNQQMLYEPPDSLYVAPRAPTDTWNLWHEPHIDVMLGRLIEDAIAFGGVNPNRVYLMGYSAGGDGVYQLAPRLADRFAAAAMMAGHPNDASPLGLRNLPFAIHVGALDDGYDRNKVAAQWKERLDVLHKGDPEGYTHDVQLHDGRGHWMNREDRVALPWMARFTRNPLPERIVWEQGNVPHDQFYWLSMTAQDAKKGQCLDASLDVSREAQTLHIGRADDVVRFAVLFNDAMLDLDRPVKVVRGDHVIFDGIVPRTIADLKQSIDERSDPYLIFPARLSLRLPP